MKNELEELIKKDIVSAKDVRKFCEKSRSVICGIILLFELSNCLNEAQSYVK